MIIYTRRYPINEENVTNEQTLGKYKKGELLIAFTARRNFSLPLEIQPSDNTLLIIAKMHERRPGEFVPPFEGFGRVGFA